jgi:hypothetical protein
MIQRKKPLKRSTKPLKRTPVRTRRTTPRRRAGACRPYLDWLKTQACRVTGKHSGEWAVERERWGLDGTQYIAEVWVTVDPAHVRTKRLGGDLNNAISLARHLHEEQHAIGIPAFNAKYGVSMKELAIAQTEEWLATPEGLAWLDVQQEGTAE